MELNVLHGLQAFSGGAAGALVASVWQGVVLAAGIWLCLRLIPRAGAATRFAIWMTAFGVLAVLPLVRLHPTVAASGIVARGPLVHVDVRWSLVLTAIWAAMSLYGAAGLALNGWKLWGVWRRASVVEAGAEVSSLLDGRRVELCTSEELERPSLIGFFSPRIVIPRWLFEKLSDGELRQIVMHEMEHLRRGDDWINLVQKIALVAFPLNPVLVWIERRLCLERELACDAGVIRATGAPKAYATCLTTLAERSIDHRVAALALGALERRSQLAERVYGILRREKMLSPMQAGVVMSVAVAGLVAGAAELSRCPQLVSFAVPTPMAVMHAPAAAGFAAGAEMQDVVYRDGAAGGMLPRETLLKASMDSGRNAAAVKAPVKAGVSKVKVVKKRKVVQPQVLQVSSWSGEERGYRGRYQQRVVEAGAAPRMTFTVVEDRDTGSSYAAVQTADGWLVFAL
jgi:beta-lactamase regulating signal transducer with metallopeptidase domain